MSKVNWLGTDMVRSVPPGAGGDQRGAEREGRGLVPPSTEGGEVDGTLGERREVVGGVLGKEKEAGSKSVHTLRG